ncbi:helix-turn-helix domain-containing protein [Microbacterium sp. P04]|uniref:helix-turn-helix domain-containing protein n=1 Tax=Microbacterium sp. P04 TaxID=3366947 RepID=UPI003746C776
MVDDSGFLDIAGLDRLSERVYLDVLRHGSSNAERTAERFGLGLATATAVLEGLRSLGLTSRLNGDDHDYVAVNPGYSLGGIADRMGDQVVRIRTSLPKLVELFERVPPGGEDQTQTLVLTEADAVAAWYTRLQHEARSDFLAFDRSPYVSASLDPVEASTLDRGVRWRVIYTISSFDDDGTTWDEVAELAQQGEEGRIVSELPVKLAIADGRAALVSLTLEPGNVSALVTFSPALIEALRQLFEFHWARSVPIEQDRLDSERPLPSVRDSTMEERAILSLMAVGMKDDAIARQLQISARTLRRRSQDLMSELGASTRFQAGIEAARRGWV